MSSEASNTRNFSKGKPLPRVMSSNTSLRAKCAELSAEVFGTDITPRGLRRVLPAHCLARRSSPAALRRRLSSAAPPQLCDAISALRHHLSSATPSQLCDTISALRHHLSSATPSAFPTGKRSYLCRKHL